MRHFVTHRFFFNDTATTEIYTLSLHDALPIWMMMSRGVKSEAAVTTGASASDDQAVCQLCANSTERNRSEEHTSELKSRQYLVCRLLLEKKYKLYFTLSAR